jgi:hypothetical protein
MQNLPVFFLALVALIATSCSSDPEDKAFFGKGWMHPESGADQRIGEPQNLVPIKSEYDRPPKQAGPGDPAPPPAAEADR